MTRTVKLPRFTIAASIFAAACTRTEPPSSSPDSESRNEKHDDVTKKPRGDLRAGETDLVDDDYVRNGVK